MTYDPRGAERSIKDDPSSESILEQHAEDLHRIIQEIGGPVDLFASSGGAVNALALVAAHPEDVRTLIAHEPPLCTVLPDEDNAKAAVRAISDTYQQRGFGAGMAHFIAITGHRGEFPEDIGQQPVPDPAQFGMPTEDDGSRTDVMLYQTIIGTTHYQPDFDALRGPRPDRHGRRRRVGGRDGEPRRVRRRQGARHGRDRLPQPPRRLPGRRVRLGRRARCVRGEAAGGPRCARLASISSWPVSRSSSRW